MNPMVKTAVKKTAQALKSYVEEGKLISISSTSQWNKGYGNVSMLEYQKALRKEIKKTTFKENQKKFTLKIEPLDTDTMWGYKIIFAYSIPWRRVRDYKEV